MKIFIALLKASLTALLILGTTAALLYGAYCVIDFLVMRKYQS